jgi:hypothetical protein
MSEKLKREMRDIEDFSKIELRGWGDITLTQGDSCQLVVEGLPELLDRLHVEVKAATLILSFEDNYDVEWNILKQEAIHFTITMPVCESIRIGGKGSVTAHTLKGDDLAITVPGVGNFTIDTLNYKRVAIDVMGVSQTRINQISAEALALSIKGTGKIQIENIQADSLAAAIKGSGEMRLAGQVKTQAISVPGVGNYDAGYLQTESISLVSNGMTNSTLWATEDLTIQLNGMGNVRYYGSPTLQKHIKANGHIHMKHLGDAPTVKV